ncbi:MAG TPA: hypothetical protein VM327_03150 [Candidatus Thermoplasmatota archaeon]|nr:hypothetical protein [Candidatus Thermoplasmatota archaeon]
MAKAGARRVYYRRKAPSNKAAKIPPGTDLLRGGRAATFTVSLYPLHRGIATILAGVYELNRDALSGAVQGALEQAVGLRRKPVPKIGRKALAKAKADAEARLAAKLADMVSRLKREEAALRYREVR